MPDSPLSPFKWFRLYLSFFDGERAPTDPMFLAQDRVRPYTYSAATSDLKHYLSEVSDDIDFGIHGIRVQGYNDSKSGNGEDITVAHGLWSSKQSAGRYERFSLLQVCSIAAGMVGQPSRYAAAEETTPAPRVISRAGTVRRSAAPSAAERPDGAPPLDGGAGPSQSVPDEDDPGDDRVDPAASPLPRPTPPVSQARPQLSPPPGWTVHKIGDSLQVAPPYGSRADPVDSVDRAWAIYHAQYPGRGGRLA